MHPFFLEIMKSPLNIAPERGDELAKEIFGELQWELVATKAPPSRADPFSSDPPNKRITVTYSGLAMVWCIACYSVFLCDVVSDLHQSSGQAAEVENIGQAVARIRPILDYAIRLRTKDADWPDSISIPDVTREDDPWGSIQNVFLGAVAFILLHEIAHVSLQHKAIVPAPMRISQEDQADAFAAKWLFERVVDERQREFRILVVGVALAWLLLFEPIGGDPLHPLAHQRLRSVSSYFGADQNSAALEVVADILKSLFLPAVRPPSFENAQASFDWLIAQLRAKS
jgi:hypothetical protein